MPWASNMSSSIVALSTKRRISSPVCSSEPQSPGKPRRSGRRRDILRALEAAHEDNDKRFLIFLDEFNRCREMARNGIMPALDSTRRMYNPLTGSTISIPENVLWIAAVNNGSQFTGTTNVDPAQLDRFAPLKMDYPPEKEEVRVLSERHPDVPVTQIERAVKAANGIRHSEELGVDLSVRATEEVCILLGHPNFADFDGDPLPDLLQTSFCGRFVGRWDDPSTDAGLVWQTIVRAAQIMSPLAEFLQDCAAARRPTEGPGTCLDAAASGTDHERMDAALRLSRLGFIYTAWYLHALLPETGPPVREAFEDAISTLNPDLSGAESADDLLDPDLFNRLLSHPQPWVQRRTWRFLREYEWPNTLDIASPFLSSRAWEPRLSALAVCASHAPEEYARRAARNGA